jgi:hypothetical protein
MERNRRVNGSFARFLSTPFCSFEVDDKSDLIRSCCELQSLSQIMMNLPSDQDLSWVNSYRVSADDIVNARNWKQVRSSSIMERKIREDEDLCPYCKSIFKVGTYE